MTHEVPDIVTPCCGATLNIHTTYTGGYLGSDVPSEILCDGPGCYNSWTPEGWTPVWERERSVGVGTTSGARYTKKTDKLFVYGKGYK